MATGIGQLRRVKPCRIAESGPRAATPPRVPAATGIRAVHVRIRRAVDDAGWMNEQIEPSEPGTGGKQEEKHGSEERQVSRVRGRHRQQGRWSGEKRPHMR